jgi:hypothetical protein
VAVLAPAAVDQEERGRVVMGGSGRFVTATLAVELDIAPTS